MRKSLVRLSSLVSFVLLITAGAFLINCGNDSHPLSTVSTQFAFIRAAASSGSFCTSAHQRHMQAERSLPLLTMRPRTQGRGIAPLASGIESGTDSIMMMNNDGTGETTLANQAGFFGSVQLSYDGKFGVGTAADLDGWQQVFYADLRNKNNIVITQLTTDAEHHSVPQLSWDGKQIIFVKWVSDVEKGQAVIMSPSNPGVETIIPTPFNVNFPSFTPGGKIVFEEEDNDTINIMNADGTGNVRLTNPDHVYFDEFPAVSPDGKIITFSRYPADESTGEDIWTVNIDGTSPKQLTTDGASWDPMIVKDKVVFVSYRDNATGDEIYSMSLLGTNQKRLTNNTVSDYFIW